MSNSAYTPTFNLSDGSATEQKLAAGATLKLSTEQATTSGTSIDFTGIPVGVKMIVVSLIGVSTNGSSTPLIQLGDSGGVETTGYNSIGGGVTASAVAGAIVYTTGFGLRAGGAANVIRGQAILVLEDSTDNTWSMMFSLSDASNWLAGAGAKALSATLDRIRLTTVNGTDTFDAGSINIAYK